MQLSSAPTQIQLPFANGDLVKTNPIPVPSQISIQAGRASFTDGFPPVCAQPVISGGVPPFKSDMDGILFMLSSIDLWASAGAGFPYSSGYSIAIGGYPKGSRVLMASGAGYWLSIADNNVTDPDTGGAGWVPFGTRAAASVYASAQQTLATGNSKVLWDTVEFDTYGQWNAGNSRFQALWAGKYRFSGSIYLPAAAGQYLSAMIYKNGAFAKQCADFPQTSDSALSYAFDAIISCAVGDYLETFMNVSQTNVLAGQAGSNEAYVYGQIEFLGN